MEARRHSHPALYAEHLALVEAMTKRAEYWRSHEICLPQGVQLVSMLDDDGRTVYGIDWGREPPVRSPTFFYDRCCAVELVWTIFMLHRPWAIDDDRLRELVEHPPVPHSRLLGELLSIRFVSWLRQAFGPLANACIESAPPDQPIEVLESVFRSFAALFKRCDARAGLSIYELSGLLDVTEPDAGLGQEAPRWHCMLSDYTHALDPQLHQRLHALNTRFEQPRPRNVQEALSTFVDCRQLDACLGLLLARATMLDPNARPSVVQGYVDPMSTDAAGSFAWWCGWSIDAWADEYPLGDRLRPEEIPRFVGFALHKLHELDAGLLEALLRVFPIEA